MNNYSDIVKNKVLSALNEYSMLQDTETVVVGFSGGADSVCLLHILNTLSGLLNIRVRAIHINHGIRGDEAVRDQKFAEDFCNKINVPCKTCCFDCIGESEVSKESLEECARRIRYGYFSREENDKTKIATAHNANDNAETVIFNISRGSSFKGACGIPPVRGAFVRPLINCTRTEIEGYCIENNLSFVTDSTNLCDDYTRNKIRHKILPVTEEINTASIDNFSRFSHNSRLISDYISIESHKAADEALKGENSYDISKLKSLHPAILNEVIYIALSHFTAHNVSSDKIDAIKKLVYFGGRTQLYGDENAEVVKNKLRFYHTFENTVPKSICIDDYKQTIFGEYIINFTKFTDCSNIFNKNMLDNSIDCDKITGSLFLRTRQSGDRFTLPKRNVTKTLKNLFNEFCVPVEKRETLPLICDDKGIVWIYSIGTSARCKITEKSENIIYIEGEPNVT